MDKICVPIMDFSSKWILLLWNIISSLAILQIYGSAHVRQVEYNISEGVPNGHTIGDLLSDAKLYDEFHSDIVKSLFFKALSSMPTNISLAQESGKLVVNGDLDREKICLYDFYCEMTINIAVQPQEYFRIIKVNIKVFDKNDNRPKFSERRFFTTLPETSERGTLVQLPYAEDKDSLKYGVKGYELVPRNNHFKLQIRDNVDGSQDVTLVLNKELDFETQSRHNLSLIAYDGGDPRKSGSIQIVVLVSDANDHIPYFVNTSYEITINENILIGHRLVRVKAVDGDSGLNSLISYRFSDQTLELYGKYFTINNATGDIIVRYTIDYEKHKVFHLAVVAHDMGPNSHLVDTTVIIRVLDENDCSPEIEINTLGVGGSMGIADVSEESPIGTFIAHINVKDQDTGRNGQVQCHLQNSQFILQTISEDEYQLETNRIFDRESDDSYNVILNCTDRGANPKSATQLLKVQITDVNDHSPVFTQRSYEGSVLENSYQGETVLQVNATDRDIGRNAKIKYLIADGNIRKYFHIDPSSGVITTRKTFDREQKNSYIFSIIAQDHGSPKNRSSTTQAIVIIRDVNDETPTFTRKSFTFHIVENQPVGTLFGKVSAIDNDDISNNQFKFRVVENSENSFSIDPTTGDLRTTQSLDREFRSRHRLVIKVEDEGSTPRHSVAFVHVIVLDMNDNIPQFTFPSATNNSLHIPASIPKNYAVAKISCSDPDAGNNGTITYVIVPKNAYFYVNESTGLVITKQSIDARDGKIFEISFLAHDNGTPKNIYSSTTHLKLIVNKSLLVNSDFVQQQGGILSPANFRTVIIASVVLAFIIISLILIIICIYCRRSAPPAKKEARYDKFQIREATVDNFHDSDTSHMAALHTSTHEYAKDNDLMDDSGLQLDDYDYPRKLTREPMSYPVSYLMSKKANGHHPNHHHHHHYDYQKPVSCDYATIQRPDQDQDSTYSGDGSNTDSGKGPSEEGDNNHLQNQGIAVACNIPLAPVLEEDQRSNNDSVISCSNKYATMDRGVRSSYSDVPTSNPYGFTRTLPHTVISGIPKCKCKSCNNMNRFKTGMTSRQKDIIVPHTNGDHHNHDYVDSSNNKPSHVLEDCTYRVPPGKTFRYDRPYVTNNTKFSPASHQKQRCETEFTAKGPIVVNVSPRQNYSNGARTYAPADYQNGTTLDPLQPHEEHDGSSTTSGSYVVDHHDMSDVMNDSHWNIREAVCKDSVV